MAPHGAVGTEEVVVKAEEISAGKGGLSSTAGFYLTSGHTTGTKCTSAPKNELQLCCVRVICNTRQSSVHMFNTQSLVQ